MSSARRVRNSEKVLLLMHPSSRTCEKPLRRCFTLDGSYEGGFTGCCQHIYFAYGLQDSAAEQKCPRATRRSSIF